MKECLICERIALWREGKNPYLIHEFPRSIFAAGDARGGMMRRYRLRED